MGSQRCLGAPAQSGLTQGSQARTPWPKSISAKAQGSAQGKPLLYLPLGPCSPQVLASECLAQDRPGLPGEGVTSTEMDF